MTLVYFDCFAGAAGDMILGALVDAGASVEAVRSNIDKLRLPGCRVEFSEVVRSGLRATKAVVTTSTQEAPRTMTEIAGIVESAGLEENVVATALQVFELLARAEARVHRASFEEVRLHEVGMDDSIVDVVGSIVALHHFSPSRVVCSALPLGGGTTRSGHGTLPVPGPAVVELLRGVPVRAGGTHETVTPTGAALLVAFSEAFGDLPPMRVDAVGYGAGDRDTDGPNAVRVIIGTAIAGEETTEYVRVMEANLDDLNPELLPYVIEQLLAAGAQDAWLTPVLMKKGRPGFLLAALFRAEDQDRIADVFFRETTTLGIRIIDADKIALPREWVEIEVEGHPLRVKVGRRGGAIVTASPEYEDALQVARATGLALRDVYVRAQATLRDRSKTP